MVKVEATETFTFKDYGKVQIVTKKGERPNEFQQGDTFVCDDETAEYLGGKNPLNKSVVKIVEVIPKEKPEKKPDKKPKKKITKE